MNVVTSANPDRDKMRWNFETREWMPSPGKEIGKFPKGHCGNPGGVPAQERAQMLVNAEKATFIRKRLLDALESKIESAIVRAEVQEGEVVGEDGISIDAAERVMKLLKGDTLRLLADAEDRGYGKPTQRTHSTHTLSKDVDLNMSPETAAEIYQRELIEGR